MPQKTLPPSFSLRSTLCVSVSPASASGEQDHSLLSAIVVASDDAILSKTLDGIIMTWNAAAERMFGYTAEEIIGKPKTTIFPPDRLHEEEGILARVRRGLRTDHFETIRLHKDGTPIDVSVTISPIKDAKGQVVAASAILRNITERKHTERDLRESEERLRLAVEGSQLGTWHWDIQANTQVWSKRCLELLGRMDDPPQRIPALLETIHPEDRERVNAYARRGFTGESEVADEFRVVWPDGSIHWLAAQGRAFLGDDGTPLRMEGILLDTTDKRAREEQLRQNLVRIEQQNAALESQQATLRETNARLEYAVNRLERLATTDGLTGLTNHGAFQNRLKEEYDRAMRYHSPFSVVLLNLDRFKQYNDTYGYPAGDIVLKHAAEILQREARRTDVVARYGGEEFVLIMPETEAEEARQLAERLRQAIASAFWAHAGVTASFGIATSSVLLPDATTLVVQADKAVYRSKYQGRNCVTHVLDALEEETLDMRTLESFNELVQTVSAGRWEMLVTASEQMKEMVIQSYSATIASWSHILDVRDKETEGHSQRVTDMMERLTRHLGMNAEEIVFARWGALLHDIGKMGVPDNILHKPGPLTDEEWVIMRQHTALAHEMLGPIKFLGPAIDIPYCHHEKWDGSGYPRGLNGEEIPLLARLFAVVDVYDALTSDRPYRKAWPEDKVRAHLQEQAGTHFDPRAVHSFMTLLEEERPARDEVYCAV